jgi:hypothetical protein
LFADWPFVAQKNLHLFFWVIRLPTIFHPCQLSFHPTQPKFSFILATQDQLDVHHSFSLASKAEEAPKLPQKEKTKQTRRKGLLLPLLLSFVDGVSLLLCGCGCLCCCRRRRGFGLSSRFFQQPSSPAGCSFCKLK